MKQKSSSNRYTFGNGYLKKGSLAQSVVVLWASISPSAVLLLPSCMKETGIIIGVLTMLFACLVLFMTQFVLMKSATLLCADNYGNTLLRAILYGGSTDTKEQTREENKKSSISGKIIAIFVNLPIFFAMAITLPCFLIIWCSCIEQLIPPISTNITSSGISYNQILLMVFCAIIMFPFSLKKELQETRHISWLSLIAGLLFAITVVQYYFCCGASLDRGKVIWWNSDIKLSSCMKMLTVSCFAFSNHENSPATAFELQNPTTNRILALSSTVSISSFALFSVITIFSYLTFGELTLQSVALNYGNEGTLLVLSKICLSISNLVACTLSLHAAISSLSNIIIALKGDYCNHYDDMLFSQSTSEDGYIGYSQFSPIGTLCSSTNTYTCSSLSNIFENAEKHEYFVSLNDKDDCASSKNSSTSNSSIFNQPGNGFNRPNHVNCDKVRNYLAQNGERKHIDVQASVGTKARTIIVFLFLVSSILLAANLQDLLLLVEVATGLFETIICLIFPALVYMKLFKHIFFCDKYLSRPIFILFTSICSLGCFTASILAILNVDRTHK
ncbi:putative aa transporter [Cryptosporidium canis]|uniref:Aa transporter n=1 Tax=Cryptosporidium canis TaxID=195482 RepID=A0A9D5DHG7_9CRYT|nr:putative aa transporter [Cryptosporidium canis]